MRRFYTGIAVLAVVSVVIGVAHLVGGTNDIGSMSLPESSSRVTTSIKRNRMSGQPSQPASNGAPDVVAPRMTRWDKTMAELMPAARAGDRQAASRLFVETRRCEKASIAKHAATFELNSLKADLSSDQASEADSMLSNIEHELEVTEEDCGDVTDEQLASAVYEVMLQAANLGDNDAAICYAGAFFDADASSLTPEGIESYRKNAMRLIQSRFEQGDWRSVTLMASAYGNLKRRGLFAQLVESDRKQYLAYLQLLSLGATGEYANTIRSQIESMTTSGELSGGDVAEEEQWAKTMYGAYFHGSTTAGDETLCDG